MRNKRKNRYTGRWTVRQIILFLVFIIGMVILLGGVGGIEQDTLSLAVGCGMSLAGAAVMAAVLWIGGAI